jgi:hypothetical protein
MVLTINSDCFPKRSEDLVFADDICLLSHRLSDIQEKIQDVEKIGKKVGLKINETKTKATPTKWKKLK